MGFTSPVNDVRITSNFGRRMLNGVWEGHQGIDLVSTKGDKSILAAADGVVIAAGILDTYGNRVLLRHNINGKEMDTLYAHLSSYSVKVGDTVKQGQKIGVMGETGRSFGIHLHFEVHEGHWLKNQPNARDPRNYVDFTKNFKKEVAPVAVKPKGPDYKGHWAEKSIQKAIDKGVMLGKPDGNWYPNDQLTRAELATVLERLKLI